MKRVIKATKDLDDLMDAVEDRLIELGDKPYDEEDPHNDGEFVEDDHDFE